MPVTLAELAIHIPGSILLFEKYDLNYYQNGKQSFRAACEEKGLPYVEIDQELALIQSMPVVEHPLTLEDMNIERLIDYINGQYHADETQVLNSILSGIQQNISNEVCEQPLREMLQVIEPQFKSLKDKLIQHCKKEDELLFPYMKKLSEMRKDKSVRSSTQSIAVIKNPIRVLEAEHVQAANILSDIKKAIKGFSITENAPQEYVALMENLKDFERDLHMHLHIENNVLFPKLIALEEEMNNKIKL